MESFLVCSSTRSRPDWASLASALLQSKTSRWKEARLDTHDVAMSLPMITPGMPRRVLRAIFMSPHDIGSDEARNRVERLYHLNGGRDIAVFFYLKQYSLHSPVAAFMKLQLDLATSREIPIVPVESVAAVPHSLMTFHRQLGTGRVYERTPAPARSLLPHCSDRQSLAEHTVHVLTDTTSDMRDLLMKLSSPNSAFRNQIDAFLGDEDGAKAVSFWAEEYMVE
ncbi:hypothetical protein F4780DRAFT_441882 [Xylariomycetidae sp. FL0641]|nr:hypothetical protein F4780DRAFT_441882 [Xylariomycetidae sp. FL0641]